MFGIGFYSTIAFRLFIVHLKTFMTVTWQCRINELADLVGINLVSKDRNVRYHFCTLFLNGLDNPVFMKISIP